jgi:hypothetical protein
MALPRVAIATGDPAGSAFDMQAKGVASTAGRVAALHAVTGGGVWTKRQCP